jgi:hypothetical protein
VKEVPIASLVADKTYFSSRIPSKLKLYNQDLLKAVVDKKYHAA